MKILVVVDMQVDFISGSLGSSDAQAIVKNVVRKVESYDGKVIFTRDTHDDGYNNTQEGRKLPVVHCVKGTEGWQLCDELKPYGKAIIDKPTFGSVDLPHYIRDLGEPIDEIELCGLCTDICVISNAMILKATFPEARLVVDSGCCAGVTKESHNTALEAMKAVQIEVIQ